MYIDIGIETIEKEKIVFDKNKSKEIKQGEWDNNILIKERIEMSKITLKQEEEKIKEGYIQKKQEQRLFQKEIKNKQKQK